MSYKDTLHLPKTDFPMRAKLPEREPLRYKAWDDNKVHEKMRKNWHQGGVNFILHDGPPYANGRIHIGHALNKILKDFVVKFNYFSGMNVEFVPGWDCHGLPIEQKVRGTVEEKLLRESCRKYASQQIDLQKEDFKALGIVADWDGHYATMHFWYESEIFACLCELAKKGLLVEREKPVHWSWAEKTALAEAEINYKDKKDTSIYAFFPFSLKTQMDRFRNFPISGMAVWTTTPWTLPANVAVAINPSEKYVLAQRPSSKSCVLMAQSLHALFVEKGFASEKIEATYDATDLQGSLLLNPLNQELKSRIILGDFVSTETGSGCVHIAPGHGETDYQIGLKHHLPMVMPVDEGGYFTNEVKRLCPQVNIAGYHVFKANPVIVDFLEERECLIGKEEITHSYPYCWRSDTPVIFRATKQFFIDVPQIREKALKALEDVKFVPEHSRDRLEKMVRERPDWCISRQREWGVPIAFFRNKGTGELLLDNEVLEHIQNIFFNFGTDCWWTGENTYFLPAKYHSQADQFVKVTDILDVWFDSGISWVVNGGQKADVYLEGHDQHRGWFQSSLLLSVALEGDAPYKKVITHGFVVDKNGEKQAKSKGNVVSPNEVIKKYGAEVLRYWVATSSYHKDLRLSDEILKGSVEGYKKIRNTFKFLLSVLPDEEPKYQDCEQLDRWICVKASKVFKEVHIAFKESDFCRGMSLLNQYIREDLSGIYMSAVKDRLYCDAKNSRRRETALLTMSRILKSLLGLLAPILTYTVDEVLDYVPTWFFEGDVFDLPYIPPHAGYFQFYEDYWKAALNGFHEKFDELKSNGTVKDTLEVVLCTAGAKHDPFTDSEDWFVVSDMSDKKYIECDELASFQVGEDTYRIVKSPYEKCPRCWKWLRGLDDELCTRCQNALG